MKLKRRFFDSSVNFKLITKERLILGIVIGLAFTYFLYGFQYLMREAFRLMSKGFGHLPNILNVFERRTFNWFMAALSLVIGNSVAVSYIFSGNLKKFRNRSFKNRRIVANQTFLNSYFLFWFAKISYVIAMLSMGFVDFNFLPGFIVPLILLILVLYFETWKTLITVLGKHKYKYLLLHFLGFVLFSFGLSRIDFVNYKELDTNQLMYSPILDLPKSNFSNFNYFGPYKNVFLSKENNNELLFGNYKDYLSESYPDFLDIKLRNWRPEFFSIRLLAEGSTKMKVIKEVQQQVFKAGMNTIIYATKNEDEVARRFSFDGIKIKFRDNQYFENSQINQIGLYREELDVEKDFKPNDTLSVFISDQVIIDSLVVPKNMLARKFKNYINPNIIFEYNFDSNTKYQDYIWVLSAHLKAVHFFRIQNQNVELQFDNKTLRYKNKEKFLKDQQRLCDEYPFRVVEKYNEFPH